MNDVQALEAVLSRSVGRDWVTLFPLGAWFPWAAQEGGSQLLAGTHAQDSLWLPARPHSLAESCPPTSHRTALLWASPRSAVALRGFLAGFVIGQDIPFLGLHLQIPRAEWPALRVGRAGLPLSRAGVTTCCAPDTSCHGGAAGTSGQ